MGVDELIAGIFGLITLTGAAATALHRNPYDKLIMLGMMVGGILPFIVDRGYLDVAAATAIIAPLGTIFTLLVCRGREHGP
jgi:energy-converting hydrogenase A subunit D